MRTPCTSPLPSLALCGALVACDAVERAARSEPEGSARALSTGADEAAAAARCEPAPASVSEPRIDDFEDGDGFALPAAHRLGYWASWHDATGGTLVPDTGRVLPARDGERAAMHFQARGFRQWGATLSLNLRWVDGGMRCPFNASRYAGIRLTVRGQGSLPVQVATTATSDVQGGGSCLDRCFDHYQRIIQLTPEWTPHELRWSALAQEGWGQPAAFDPARVVGIHFSARVADLPLDAWIDDLELLPGG